MSNAPKLFKTTVLGVGPFCVEFDDGEIVHTRSEDRQRLIAAAPELLAACEAAKTLLQGDLVEPGRKVFWACVRAIEKAQAA